MRTKELITQLMQLGLSQHEAALYLHGLKSGPSLLAPLARGAEIPRSTTYEIVEHLANRGLFSVQQHRKRTLYEATPPTKILQDILRQEQLIRQLIPHLDSLMPEPQQDEAAEAKTQLPLEIE